MRHVCGLVFLLITGCASGPPAHILCIADCGISEADGDYQPVPPMLPLPGEAPPVSPAIMPSQSVRADLDGDGQEDRASAYMRPHTMRLDVEIVLAKQANRTINVMAYRQPPTGELVYAQLRPLAPGRYAYACERNENLDVASCKPGFVHAANGGIEVTAGGLPRLLIWIDGGAARTVRLED